VIEADEYDTAFFDKRSKFVHYRPRTAVLNNLEFDHADIFADLAAIETQFHHLVRTVPGKGRLIVNGSAPALDRVIARGAWSEKETFGEASEHSWRLEDVNEAALTSQFKVHYDAASVECSLALAGKHNRLNAVAAIAAARHIGLTPEYASKALASFEGVKRRLEVRGTEGGVTVIDDFAHHPTAIETTIAGLRARVGKERRILAVLEPRSNTMKMGAVKDQLAPSLVGADKVFCFEGGLGWDTAQALAPLGIKSNSYSDLSKMIAAIHTEAKANDVILVMSNGGFGGIHQKLLDGLKLRI
jgi:UDP-N-acetylmuramate: L-alanyl-gamma-D-glutamyl-meso-diaminopimelate ligase